MTTSFKPRTGFIFSSSTTSIESMSFPTETLAAESATLSTSQAERSPAFSKYYGYAMGGVSSGTVSKLAFKTRTTVNAASSLGGTLRTGAAGVSSRIAGYRCGGAYNPGTTTYLGTVDKLFFPTETSLVLGSGVSAYDGRTGVHSTINGYICGGGTSVPYNASQYSTVDMISFQTETISSISGMVAARAYMGSANISSYALNVGYLLGGQTAVSPVSTSTIQELSFTTNTVSYSAYSLYAAMSYSGAYYSKYKGYGLNSAMYITSVNFQTRTISQSSSQMNTAARSQPIGVQG